ncbi:MAG: FG-GAP-like repeat-containing protein [Spirochaetota bacterium]|nr:FG-GAP-like repeat-containing protein [Spirochaetota bacterium]
MKNAIAILNILLSLSLLYCSNMIQEGIDSTKDPRIPEINVKQGADNILSPSGRYDIVGVKVNDSSPNITFLIENLGLADLMLTGEPIITISCADCESDDIFQIEQPSSSIIPAGRNVTFSVTYNPELPGNNSATISIMNNDLDEGLYTFTVSGNTNPVCDFNTRLRKGIISLTVDFEDKSLGDITLWEWDFNGDGVIDSNEQNPSYTYNSPGSYSVMLTLSGPGGSHYKIRDNYITVIMPIEHSIDSNVDNIRNVVAADLNGDGEMDVLAASGGKSPDYIGEIAWWKNNGNGSFGDKQIIASILDNSYYNHVVAVDLDDDENIDVLAASGGKSPYYIAEIAWWRNNGDDTFGEKQSIVSFPYARMVCAADIDGVNGLDVLAVGRNSAWWANDGSGNFTGDGIIIDDWYLGYAYLTDIDNDNDLDVLASTSGSPGRLQWHENTSGDGTSWTKHIFDDSFHNCTSLTTIDIDDDNDLDTLGLGIVNFGEPKDIYEIIWWENTDGNGTFGPRITLDSDYSRPSSLFTTDIDGDGKTDVLGTGDSLIAMWNNNGNEGFTKKIINYQLLDACSVYAADMDGNGDMDVLAAGDSISWYNIRLDGWYRHTISETLNGANSVNSADIDGDGDMDILNTASGSLGSITWWENIDNESFVTISHPIDTNFTGACSCYALDMDLDGDIDVIGAGDGDGVIWWENTEGNGLYWDRHEMGYVGGGDESVYAADMDNDGDLDVIESMWGSAWIIWWENDGTLPDDGTQWDYHNISPMSWGGPRSVMAADIDGDDDMDVLSANGGIRWWENMDGCGSFPNGGVEYPVGSLHTIDDSFFPSYYAYALDMDKDGDIDVLGAAGGDIDEIAWWENNGDGTFGSRQTVSSSFDGASSVYAADLDGDGDMDIAATARDGDKIAWWKNPMIGNNTEWIEHTIAADFDGASSVFITDIDDDGDMDIIATASDNGEIVVWENNILDYGP